MELRHLRYFLAVAEAEHYGRAAARLHVTQPALSRRIRDLEQDLGVELFERLPRGVRLTAAGLAFLEDARQVLASTQDAAERARRVARGQSGILRVAFVESAAWQGVVPTALGAFRKANPNVELRAHVMSSQEQSKALSDGDIDVGFVCYRPESAALDYRTVDVNGVAVALSQAHKLARRANVRLQELAEESFVFFPRKVNPTFYDALMAACREAGFAPNVVQEALSEPVILSLVAAGIGVTFVNSMVHWRRPCVVRLRPVDGLTLPLPLDCVWLRRNSTPTLANFIQTVWKVADR